MSFEVKHFVKPESQTKKEIVYLDASDPESTLPEFQMKINNGLDTRKGMAGDSRDFPATDNKGLAAPFGTFEDISKLVSQQNHNDEPVKDHVQGNSYKGSSMLFLEGAKPNHRSVDIMMDPKRDIPMRHAGCGHGSIRLLTVLVVGFWLHYLLRLYRRRACVPVNNEVDAYRETGHDDTENHRDRKTEDLTVKHSSTELNEFLDLNTKENSCEKLEGRYENRTQRCRCQIPRAFDTNERCDHGGDSKAVENVRCGHIRKPTGPRDCLLCCSVAHCDEFKSLGLNDRSKPVDFRRMGFKEKSQYDECRGLGFENKSWYDEFKALEFSDVRQYNEYKRLGFSEMSRYEEFKRLGFASKASYEEYKRLGLESKSLYDEFKAMAFPDANQFLEFKRLGFIEKSHYDEYRRLGFASKASYEEYKKLGFCDKANYDEFRWLSFADKTSYDEYKRLGFSTRERYDEFRMLGFTDKTLFDEYKRLGFVSVTSYHEYRQLGFHERSTYDEYKRLGFLTKASYDEYKRLRFATKRDYDEYIALGFDNKEDYDNYKRLNDQNESILRFPRPKFKILGFDTESDYDEYKRFQFSNKTSFDEFRALGFTEKVLYDEYKTSGFSTKSSFDEFKRIGFADKEQYDEFKSLGFTRKDDYIDSLFCLVCSKNVERKEQRVGCPSGHFLCLGCAKTTLETALRNSTEQIHPQGIRCPRHPEAIGGCPNFLTSATFEHLRYLTRTYCPPSARVKRDSISRLERFIGDANVKAAIRPNFLMDCPNPACGYPIWIAEQGEGENSVPPRARCPNCKVFICRFCRVPYHTAMTCQEYQERQRQQKQEDNRKTEEYIKATTKPCPSCGIRTSHFHGHECHHIRPGGGCTNCHVHWCYSCGCTEEENERERNHRRSCRCEAGYWSTFCRNEDIVENIVQLPYPHDRRCGCQICPECRPGAPCESCNGTCVVCVGIIPHGPPELPTPEPVSPPPMALEQRDSTPPPPPPRRRRRRRWFFS